MQNDLTITRSPGDAKLVAGATTIEHGAFDIAFQYFNQCLFEGSLPDTLITLQWKKQMRGYFWSGRFGARDGSIGIDEIALNPSDFATRTDEEVLSTLVHEMAHSWQKYHGTKPSAGYHDLEWAAKMEALGLIPSHNGKPSGRRTGRQMTHFIVPGGPFDQAVKALMAQGFRIAYVEAGRKAAVSADPVKARLKITFTCPGCGDKAWGKASLKIRCEGCEASMTP